MRNALILAAASLLAASASAQQVPPKQEGQENPTIVVTGHALADTAKALKDCIARHCPPDEDAAATIAHAENQFVAGDYHGARTTLLGGIGRDKRYAKQYPVPVSDLLRANARVAAHLGEGSAYRLGSMDVVSALKAGLGSEDPRTLVAEVELSDAFARFGRFDLAERRYRDVAEHARRINQPVVEGFALLRVAAMFADLAEMHPGEYRLDADKALDTLIRDTNPQHRVFSRAALVLKARLAARFGDKSAVDTVLAQLSANPTDRPVLLYADTIKLPESTDREARPLKEQLDNPGNTQLAAMAVHDFEKQWVDVSFWIAPDGHPTDIGVLRQSDKFEGEFLEPVLTAIRSRRYAPLKLDPADPGILRVERYTFTSRWVENAGTYGSTGSRIRAREPDLRIEMLDLSADAPPAKG